MVMNNHVPGLIPRTIGKVTARSASDKTNDWPFWMVWTGSLNVTGDVANALGIEWRRGAVFCPRACAEHMAEAWNAWGDVS